jgi:hypothetical protein
MGFIKGITFLFCDVLKSFLTMTPRFSYICHKAYVNFLLELAFLLVS